MFVVDKIFLLETGCLSPVTGCLYGENSLFRKEKHPEIKRCDLYNLFYRATAS